MLIKKQLTFLFVCVASFAFSQNIKLTELLKLKDKTIQNAETVLANKDWMKVNTTDDYIEYTHATKTLASVLRPYIRLYTKNSPENKIRWVEIINIGSEKAAEYEKELKTLGAKSQNITVGLDRSIIRYFKAKNNTFQMKTFKNDESDNEDELKHNFLIFPNEDYTSVEQ